MATAQTIVTAKPQLIPTNVGERTFATPPEAMQRNIVPNDLFYIRNHWKGAPDIDAETFRLAVDGEVERHAQPVDGRAARAAAEAVRGDVRVLRQQHGAGVLGEEDAGGDGAAQGSRHHGERRVGRRVAARRAGDGRAEGLGGGGAVRGRRPRPGRGERRPAGGDLRARPAGGEGHAPRHAAGVRDERRAAASDARLPAASARARAGTG